MDNINDSINLAQVNTEEEQIIEELAEYAWMDQLERNEKQQIKLSMRNLLLILENDYKLQGLYYNELLRKNMLREGFLDNQLRGDLTNDAESLIATYIAQKYDIYKKDMLRDALTAYCHKHKAHPIKDFIEGQVWDGVPRLGTLLIDYLGAEDNEYVRGVTAMLVVAAIARIYEPGCKFDHMVVLTGPQGIGKSEFFRRLSLGYHTDSLNFNKLKGKEGPETLCGKWIVELGEMVGFKKAEQEMIKAFISSCSDTYRTPYDKLATDHPRQCIIVGTTNEENGFLTDTTGNRRYLPIHCSGKGRFTPFDLSQDILGQILAEAFVLYKSQEVKLYLDGDLLKLAQAAQNNNMEEDDRCGLLKSYLDMPIPDNWYSKDIDYRRSYFRRYLNGENMHIDASYDIRRKITSKEIAVELFNLDINTKNTEDKNIKRMLMAIGGWQSDSKHRGSFAPYGQQRYYFRTEIA